MRFLHPWESVCGEVLAGMLVCVFGWPALAASPADEASPDPARHSLVVKSAQYFLTSSAANLEALVSDNLREKGDGGLPDFGK